MWSPELCEISLSHSNLLGDLQHSPAVAASMSVLAFDHAVTHPVSNLIAVGTFDLHAIIVLNALLLATLPDVTQL